MLPVETIKKICCGKNIYEEIIAVKNLIVGTFFKFRNLKLDDALSIL